MEGLGSVKRKRKKTVVAVRKRKRKSSGVGVGAIAGAPRRRRRRTVGAIAGVRRRRRRRTVGAIAGRRRRKSGARGFGAIAGGNTMVNAVIKGGEIAAGAMLAAFATTALLQNKTDPEKDKKMKKLRGPAAGAVGLALMFLVKNPHVENIAAGMLALGVMRSIGDFILVDKKDKIGLGIAEDVSGYELGADEVGELQLYGDPSLMAAEQLYGDPSLMAAEQLYGVGDLPLTGPEEQFSGQLVPMQGFAGPFEDAYARGNDNYREKLSGLGYSLMN